MVIRISQVVGSKKRPHEDEAAQPSQKRTMRTQKIPAKFDAFQLDLSRPHSWLQTTQRPSPTFKIDQGFFRFSPSKVDVKYSAVVQIDPACEKTLKRCWSQLKTDQIANPENPECRRYIACIQGSREDGLDPWAQKHEVKWIDSTVGYGLFAKVSYKKNETIGFYTGHLTTRVKNLDYAFEWPDTPYETNKICIDGRKQGNATRFMNHAPEKFGKICNPCCNVSTVEFFYNGLPYIIFIAQRSIFSGEQLCYDYGIGYWEYKGISPTIF